ncbi:SHOCT domain-containing protein [Paenarthrobacter sp. NPDC089675]|uniref:SHOCT domain-containing protein n=1 Tax=Paenarthrobacter sp. NPDC089675 TaxID=3364376 RepID=UPI00380490D8
MEVILFLLIVAGIMALLVRRSNERSKARAEHQGALAGFDSQMAARSGFEKTRWHADAFVAVALDSNSNQIAYAEAPNYLAKFVEARKLISVTVYEDQRSITHTHRGRQIGAAYIGNKVAGSAGAVIGALGARSHSEDQVNRVTLRIELEDATKPVLDVEFLRAPAPRASSFHEKANREARTWSSLITAMIRSIDEATPHPISPEMEVSGSRLEMLEKLATLKERGTLTQEEFEAEKARILGLGH